VAEDADAAPDATVEIHYTRPPSRLTIFEQRLVHRTAGCIVTLLEHTPLTRPLDVEGRTILEPGSPVVWFTFEGLWHDIGRFHAGGAFTGWYANILTPVRFHTPRVWETTDLFLDVWLGADADGARLLDEDELLDAVQRGWVREDVARQARSEAGRVLAAAATGAWPPRIARTWTLERARRRGTRDADTV
jgi:predicted RNA-binding protein associated with RNAse of E/G family